MKNIKNKQIQNEESVLVLSSQIDNTKVKLQEIINALEKKVEEVKENINTVTSILQDDVHDSPLQTPIEDLDLEWLRKTVGSKLADVSDLVGIDLTNCRGIGALRIQKVLDALKEIGLIFIIPSGINFLIQNIIDNINTELENLKNSQLNIPNTKRKTINEITPFETYFTSNEASLTPIEFPNCFESNMSSKSREYVETTNRQLSDFKQILEYQVKQVRSKIDSLELNQEESNKQQLLQTLISDTNLPIKTKNSLIENGFSYIKDLIGCDLSTILNLPNREIKDLINLLVEMDLVTILPFGLDLIIENITKNISEDAQTVNKFNLYKSHYTPIHKSSSVSLFYESYGELTRVSSYKLDLLGVSEFSKKKTIKKLSELELALSELTPGEKVAKKITSETPITLKEFQDFINDEISLLFLIDYVMFYEYKEGNNHYRKFRWEYENRDYKWLSGRETLNNRRNSYSTDNKKIKRIEELSYKIYGNSLMDFIQKKLCYTVSTGSSLYSDLAIELMKKIVVENECLENKSDMIEDLECKFKAARLKKSILDDISNLKDDISNLKLKVEEYKQLSNEDNEVIDKLNSLISLINQK